MTILAIDLTAPITLNLIIRAASGGILEIAVTYLDLPVDISGAQIKYVAAFTVPVEKTVGNGITIVDAPNGIFQIEFAQSDTATQNVRQFVFHECKLSLAGGEPQPVFDGRITLEQSVFTDMT